MASEPENVEALFSKAVVSARLGEFFDALKVHKNPDLSWLSWRDTAGKRTRGH